MRLTLGDARATIARVIPCHPTNDSRAVNYLNEATQRLMAKGLWKDTYQRYRVCVSNGCITWPRQIETIEAIAVCGLPGDIRNGWYEFMEAGPGILALNSSGELISGCLPGPSATLVDRGYACAFDDIVGSNKTIRVVAAVNESATARILLQGYDSTGNWIRTEDDGEWIDGEYVAISTTPTNSSKTWNPGGFVAAQKPATNGIVHIYEYDTVTTDLRALAHYEPDETRPSYRRSMVTGVSSNTDCGLTTVDVMARLRYIPVSNDRDWLTISNLGALKLEVMAILKEERNLFAEAVVYEQQALQLLRDELSQYLGDGAASNINIKVGNTAFAAGMAQVI